MIIMKKVLLGTSALMAAAALFAGAASAQTPKVTIGGFADFQAGFTSDDLDANQRGHGFRNDTEVSVKVDGKSDAGLGYGAVIDLEADVTGDADNQGLNASRTYVYLDGLWGRFELGSNQGAGETMRVDASSIAAATGGIDGAWTYFANNPAGVGFITTPSLPLAHGSLTALGEEGTDNANKITYYSPRYSGFQLGLSYQPDFSDRGQTLTRADNNAGQSGENLDLGLNYEGVFSDVSVGAAVTGQFGNAETSATEDLGAWNAGAKVGYAGFSLAGSYGSWDDSLSVVRSGTDGEYWTVGGAYDYNQFAASVTYLDSQIDQGRTSNDFNNIVVGLDYKLAPGLTPYVEASFYDFDAPGAVNDNDGSAVLVGTQLAF
jgi:outer membrane protein OmpU